MHCSSMYIISKLVVRQNYDTNIAHGAQIDEVLDWITDKPAPQKNMYNPQEQTLKQKEDVR